MANYCERVYKGWMQTLIVHSRGPTLFCRDLGPQRAVAATTVIGGAIAGGLFWPVFAVLTIWRALSVGQGELAPWREMTDVFTYILALSGIWAIVLPSLVAAKLRGLNLSWRAVVLMPAYYLLLTAATWAAMVHLVMWPYHWGKTEHGIRRLRPIRPVLRTRLSG
jgi:glycosyltransferase XagB